MYALVQDVEVVRKLGLNYVFYVFDDRIVEDNVFQSHGLRVRVV